MLVCIFPHEMFGFSTKQNHWHQHFEFQNFNILQVLPDLQKFMDSVHNRIMQCQKLGEPVETHAGETVAGKEPFSSRLNKGFAHQCY